MQALKYIANLQYTTQQLQKTVRRIRSIQDADNLPQKSNAIWRKSAIVLSSSRKHFETEESLISSHNATAHLEFLRDKLLFRRIPILLSLLERNMWVLRKVRKRVQTKVGTESNELHALAIYNDVKQLELVSSVSPESFLQDSLPEDSPMTTSVLETDNSQSPPLDSLADKPTLQHSYGSSTLTHTDGTSIPMHPTTDVLQSYDEQQLGLVTPRPMLAAVPQAKCASKILRLLHAVDSERRQLLHEKRSRLTRRIHRLEDDLTHEKKHVKFIPSKPKGAVKRDGNKLHSLTVNDEAIGESLRSDLHDAYAELELLNQSLIARSFLSARMWKLLLDEDIWRGAIAQEQRLIHGGMLHQEHHGATHSVAASGVSPLLSMSILLSRIVLAAFRDYLEGKEVNKFSPRFAVSPPSIAWLRKKQQPELKGAEGEESEAAKPLSSSEVPSVGSSKHVKEEKAAALDGREDEEEEDLLLDMIRQASDSVETRNALNRQDSTLKETSTSRGCGLTRSASKRRHSVIGLRWIPPRSTKVLPLTIETLGIFSYTLPYLPTRAIIRAGRAHDMLSLLSMLQHTATAVLLTIRGNESVGFQTMHFTLRNLENAMLTASRDFREEVVLMLREENTVSAQTPEQAARMMIEMDALHLLPLRDPTTIKLLNLLISFVFPQLRTNTLRVLVEKSRQNSLLAFATRKHRLKLYERHGHAKAESFLSGTITQQARLRQRQMAAALRGAHLDEVHQRSIADLADALSPHDLIALLQIVVGPLSAGRGPAGLESPSLEKKRLATAALFVVESLLVPKALEGAPDLPLEDWARLWVALIALQPVVERWREAVRHGPDPSSGKSEGLIVDAAMEVACQGVAAILAGRLEGIRARKEGGKGKGARRRPVGANAALAGGAVHDMPLSAQSLSIVGVGIREWRENHENGKKYAGVLRLSRQVEAVAKLLREVLLYDTSLRHELRQWEVEKREAFHREMTECLRTAELLDNTSERGLQAICFKL
ncbi:unnamed protein product [Phytomonas sp. EM1]|nr:unnamed protein product [Phytomonas sp. EM1]|eukprot:CCW63327.1 unnamed protein product [Phytomonas sp. isolate EM1]